MGQRKHPGGPLMPDPREQEAFEAIAVAYPHETYAEWPERFWELFRRLRPGISREEMVEWLRKTEATG